MSETELIISFLIGLLIVAAGTIVLSVLQFKRVAFDEVVEKQMRKLRGKKQPAVTVLLYLRGEVDDIINALQAIRKNKYGNFDVVLIDDGVQVGIRSEVREFQNKYPLFALRQVRRRRYTTVADALQAGYRKSKRGAIVLVVTPDMVLPASYIKRAVASQDGREVWRVQLNWQLREQLDLMSIGRLLTMNYWQNTHSPRLYEAHYFTREAPQDIALIDSWSLARAIVGSCTLIAVLGLSIAAFGLITVWYIWLLVVAYGLVAVWLRYGQTMRDRWVLTFTLPIAIFLIPPTSIMRGFSQLSVRK